MKEIKVGVPEDCTLIQLILKRIEPSKQFELFKTISPKIGLEVVSDGKSKFYTDEEIHEYIFGKYGGKTMIEVGEILLASSIANFVNGIKGD